MAWGSWLMSKASIVDQFSSEPAHYSELVETKHNLLTALAGSGSEPEQSAASAQHLDRRSPSEVCAHRRC